MENLTRGVDLDMNTRKTRRAAHAANSGIEHLAYLASVQRRRFGLAKQLDFDVLIEEARTGLLESKYSPIYSATQVVRQSLISVEGRWISATTGKPLHARKRSSNHIPNQNATTTNNVPPISNPPRRPYKRGDLMEYMMNHDDVNDLDYAFAYEDLPAHLKPVKPKKQGDRKCHKRKGNE
jgi:hypothetical protein